MIPAYAMRRRQLLLRALVLAPATSHELVAALGEAKGTRLFVWTGGVYRVLRTLEGEGLVASWDVPAPPVRGARPARYYEITPAGREAHARGGA